MRFPLLPGASLLVLLSAQLPLFAHPVFNLSYISGTSVEAQAAFTQAANTWSASFTDNVTIDLTVGTGSLGSGVLASTEAADVLYTYSQYRGALVADRTSVSDGLAVTHLPATSSIPIYMNYTANNPHGEGSATPYVDSSGPNTQMIRMTEANRKALGLDRSLGLPVTPVTISGCAGTCDGFIEFNNSFSYDFDRSDGISSGTFDFVGLALHEIGHALGFISGVDVLDANSSPDFYDDDDFTYVMPLDTFRCSTASVSAAATLDFTGGSGTKSFSLDNCATTLGRFSTGSIHGDGRQASHWKDNQGLGIMDPTANPGEILIITNVDLTAFDVVGWNLTPEPGTLAVGAVWVFGLTMSRRRRGGMAQTSA